MAIDAKVLTALAEKNTYVLVPDDISETQLVLEWLKHNAPKVLEDGRALTEISTHSLHPDINFVVIFRDPRKPMYEHVLDQTGTKRHVMRDEVDLLKEIIVTTPVTVGKHWARVDPLRPGILSTAGFMTAVSKQTLPRRLDFADKGEIKPSLLKLF